MYLGFDLPQVTLNLLLSPQNSTNSKLQIPLCITTSQRGSLLITGAILILGGIDSAHCFQLQVQL